MKQYKDYMEYMEEKAISRHDPTPRPFVWHIRKRVNADGTETEVSRKKLYHSVLG